ncbi:MAG: hypothetical protein ABWX84_09050 [Nocardioides sp.]
MTSHSRPNINGPTTAAKDGSAKPDGVPERPDAPDDVEERLDLDPEEQVNLTDQPGHEVDRRLQEPSERDGDADGR